MGAIKKFFTNKTTVTFVGIILGIAVLVGGYFYRVNKSLSTVKVPIAKRTLLPTEEITANDIEYIKVNPEFLAKLNVYTKNTINSVVNHYVNTGTSIPKGGFFFKSQVVEKKELPNSIFDSIDDTNTIYQLKVDEKSTFSNSIRPGDRIDLYMTTTVDSRLVNQAFITDIEVLAVRDSQGNNVFEGTKPGKSAWLLFSVPLEKYRVLKFAEFLSSIKLYPLPSNNYNLTPEETKTNKALEQLILNQTCLMSNNCEKGAE